MEFHLIIKLTIMKRSFLYMLFACFFFLGTLSCEKNNNSKGNPPEFSGELVSHTDCKNFKSSDDGIETPDSLTCISYDFDASGQILQITHINAGFNCCPDSIYCLINRVGDTLIIDEYDKYGVCDCECLFDLEIKLEGIESKVYYVKIIEALGNDEDPLCFEIDLVNAAQGSYCATRLHYPWNVTY